MERKEYDAKIERHRRQLFSMLSNGKEFLNLCEIQYQGGTGIFQNEAVKQITYYLIRVYWDESEEKQLEVIDYSKFRELSKTSQFKYLIRQLFDEIEVMRKQLKKNITVKQAIKTQNGTDLKKETKTKQICSHEVINKIARKKFDYKKEFGEKV